MKNSSNLFTIQHGLYSNILSSCFEESDQMIQEDVESIFQVLELAAELVCYSLLMASLSLYQLKMTTREQLNCQVKSAIHKSNICRAKWIMMYLFVLPFDVYLLSESSSCAVDARIMDTTEHKHLVIRLIAETTGLTHFVHLGYIVIIMIYQQKLYK